VVGEDTETELKVSLTRNLLFDYIYLHIFLAI
jgi:hypothetical protein